MLSHSRPRPPSTIYQQPSIKKNEIKINNMFMTTHTDLQPRFGITLEEALRLIAEWDPYLGDRFSQLKELTDCHEPEDLLCCNPYAVPVLQENPEYIHAQSYRYLYLNETEESLWLLRNMISDNHFALYSFQMSLTYSKIPTLDTFLTKDLTFTSTLRYYLYQNPRALSFCFKQKDVQEEEILLGKSKWPSISANPGAMDVLEAFPEHIHYSQLCRNPNPRAIALLRQNPTQIDWEFLSANPSDAAVDFLLENPHRICYKNLNRNTNPRVISVLRNHPENINWYCLSQRDSHEAIDMLLEKPDKVHWNSLCYHARLPRQFDLIRANLALVDWDGLCQNPSPLAVDLLAEHPHQIRWWYSLKHQPVFHTVTTYDYAGIREAHRDLHEAFHAWACHPDMVHKWKDWELSDLVFCEEEEEEEEKAEILT